MTFALDCDDIETSQNQGRPLNPVVFALIGSTGRPAKSAPRVTNASFMASWLFKTTINLENKATKQLNTKRTEWVMKI